MKTLYMIGGTMGVGKTTVCQQLKRDLPNSVFLDGDWCWDANPFQVTDETKAMVTNNICYLLNNFLNCSAYENIIFCWVMHEQRIIDSILKKLDTQSLFIRYKRDAFYLTVLCIQLLKYGIDNSLLVHHPTKNNILVCRTVQKIIE